MSDTLKAKPSFDEWLTQASPTALRREADEKEGEVEELLEQAEKLEMRARAIHEEVVRRRRVLEVLEEVRPAHEGGIFESPPGMTKREIAVKILSTAPRGMFPREVRAAAIERGWLPDTKEAANQLAVAMSKAARQDKLARDEEGKYSIPREDEPQDVEPQPQLLASNGPTEAQ
ncbi:MAG TPA: hypothetical protein VH042_08575 [Solirubrobacterales bacterium]|jgi:hypothetical protein|nr:hypothetical protein [Solirubrobacterales bacterium]